MMKVDQIVGYQSATTKVTVSDIADEPIQEIIQFAVSASKETTDSLFGWTHEFLDDFSGTVPQRVCVVSLYTD